VERGELTKAYAGAVALIKHHPDNAQAHFTLAYVLRYAGLLEDSMRECETAVALDPGNYFYRSCATSFMQAGKPERAMDFVRLDAGSEWANFITPSLLIREGKEAEARESVARVSSAPRNYQDLLQACLDLKPPANLDKIAHDAEANALVELDPEPRYYVGAILTFCGKEDMAASMLRVAIQQNYCAYDALRFDPILAKLRATAEFPALLAAAQQCQRKFQEALSQGMH